MVRRSSVNQTRPPWSPHGTAGLRAWPPAILEREKSALLAPGDAFPKVIVSLDPGPPGGLDGIRHLNAVAFFLGEPLPGES